ncbi:alpha-L-fucosidase-like [Euwallacea similis]|uniref:alpha-L-fucosidase-like n=1 Tax=Euwallacea similis TaxID=1736056 RepID=UPI00344BC7F7
MRVLVLILSLIGLAYSSVEENWESIDNRDVPDWYDKAKVGIFIHWGLFSVPGFDSEWIWHEWRTDHKKEVEDFISKNYPPDFTYQEFASQLTGEFLNATQWADLLKRAGAKYVVLTSKHHEGFTLWPSKYTYSFNSVDQGPHRDIVKEVGEAVKAAGLKYGLYHSLLEWYHPLYVADQANGTSYFVDQKIYPEMVELVNTYKPEIVWSDGEWEMPDTYWKSTKFLAWLFNESPVKDTVLVNDRWGSNVTCLHGDILTCTDRYNPGYLLPKKWENAMTIDWHSWGFRRNSNIDEYATTKELIELLIETVACGGNILINVGPTKEGHIAPIFQERLLQFGEWLSVNGEAIYESNPWTKYQNDTLTSGVWYTQKENSTYVSFLNWPQTGVLELEAATQLFTTSSEVYILDSYQKLSWVKAEGIVSVELPDRASVYSNDAWVLKIQH